MGLHFGDLARIRHIITFSLSPFEQRVFPHYFSEVLPNTWRRFRGSFFPIASNVVLFYTVYTWVNHKNEQSKRKNPADYANDV
ncbi:cytochrome b-c1 complex subunit 8 [Austrofundulus limnaeus]|uniref:Cytochrome b-c1 complex subunit 8 n=1 Tax=Austrofundulus limnaeus TaxID=52670 RepID=A0A2I4B9P7_AUSLI|nr:PREDICTED: cytochrome b-c1 complex subunit 8 [Austrofundulus limnaeus]